MKDREHRSLEVGGKRTGSRRSEVGRTEDKKVRSWEVEKKTNLLIFSTSDFLRFNGAVQYHKSSILNPVRVRPVRYEI